jgi:hypothetical protein
VYEDVKSGAPGSGGEAPGGGGEAPGGGGETTSQGANALTLGMMLDIPSKRMRLNDQTLLPLE